MARRPLRGGGERDRARRDALRRDRVRGAPIARGSVPDPSDRHVRAQDRLRALLVRPRVRGLPGAVRELVPGPDRVRVVRTHGPRRPRPRDRRGQRRVTQPTPGLHPAQNRALRELYAFTRQLAEHWRGLAARLAPDPAADALVFGADLADRLLA